jgi:hypothetical protein
VEWVPNTIVGNLILVRVGNLILVKAIRVRRDQVKKSPATPTRKIPVKPNLAIINQTKAINSGGIETNRTASLHLAYMESPDLWSGLFLQAATAMHFSLWRRS